MEHKFFEFGEFKQSYKSLKHELVSIEASSCYLDGTVITSWSPTQEVAGSNNPFNNNNNILSLLILGKLKCF